jgi:chemotaxis protein methyltransferase CheR
VRAAEDDALEHFYREERPAHGVNVEESSPRECAAGGSPAQANAQAAGRSGSQMTVHTGVDYAYLRNLVFGSSQNVLDPARDYMFESRLTKLVRGQGMTELEELVQHLKLRKNPALERSIAEAMTINETSFFRDSRPFELLRTDLLPRIIEARRSARRLRMWSAACSTGQESYSLGMLLLENFPQLGSWDVRIEGTDICAEVVQRAQEGKYYRIEMNRGLPARMLVRYFDRDGEEWTANAALQRLCSFRQASLSGPLLPFNRASDSFDVIFLRNVMLYFSAETRKALMAGIHRLLAPDGVLFLGSSEQPADASMWESVLAGGTCYLRAKRQASS